MFEPNISKIYISILVRDKLIGDTGKEIELLHRNCTWKFGSLPMGQKAVG